MGDSDSPDENPIWIHNPPLRAISYLCSKLVRLMSFLYQTSAFYDSFEILVPDNSPTYITHTGQSLNRFHPPSDSFPNYVQYVCGKNFKSFWPCRKDRHFESPNFAFNLTSWIVKNAINWTTTYVTTISAFLHCSFHMQVCKTSYAIMEVLKNLQVISALPTQRNCNCFSPRHQSRQKQNTFWNY